MGLSINRGGLSVLSAAQMYRAEKLATETGVTTLELMENACRSVVAEITSRWSPRKTLVVCGPGQNGGDGLGIACLLRQRRWMVEVALAEPKQDFQGNAKVMAGRWGDGFVDLASIRVEDYVLVIDALYGIGLNKALKPSVCQFLQKLNKEKIDVVAVDVPSGISADTGQVLGACPVANLTITFGRPKLGHFLLPGKAFCGRLIVADIGLRGTDFDAGQKTTMLNGPDLWLDRMPVPTANMHKYNRGHAVVVAGGAEESMGAGRLAAEAALRTGAGLVTLVVPGDAVEAYCSALPSLMVEGVEELNELDAFLVDDRKNVVLVGPGCGVNERTLLWASKVLSLSKTVVLDADGLTCFSSAPQELFDLISSGAVLTPHEGEFNRLFNQSSSADKVTRARLAAQISGAVVVFKGNDTVIAHPGGAVVINYNAPTTLATAGTGDVLAGMIAGFLAQGCSPFDAACVGVWCHGFAAQRVGEGLISDDLLEEIPHSLKYLFISTLK
jgi:hydroxyethylthiazole kinase-like uncharacterized protein yjeF